MPKSTAIRLTRKNADVISEVLGIPVRDIETEWIESSSTYYVRDCLYMGKPICYLIYNERDFLNDFASVPPGIEDRFVPVTQVKD